VGVSPYLAAADDARIRDSLLRFILEVAPRGCLVTVQDAYDLKTISSFSLPKVAPSYDTPQTRFRALRSPIAQLISWFNQKTNAAAPQELIGSAALKHQNGWRSSADRR